MQCDGHPHVCGPFNGRKFAHDLIRELHRLTRKSEGPPAYPERLWFRALAAADAKDVDRSVRALNSACDDVYFEKQHVCSAAAQLLHDFNTHHVHRTAAGATRIAPQLYDEFQASTIHEEKRGGWRERKAEPIDAAANANGQHAS